MGRVIHSELTHSSSFYWSAVPRIWLANNFKSCYYAHKFTPKSTHLYVHKISCFKQNDEMSCPQKFMIRDWDDDIWYFLYAHTCNIIFREIVKQAVLEKFAGPPDVGVYSASVQNTLYITAKAALARVPQVLWLVIVESIFCINIIFPE